MKLELLSITAEPPDDRFGHALSIRIRGESGETYIFGGALCEGARIENMLLMIGNEIKALRRRKPRPKFKTKSLMPDTWGKSDQIPAGTVIVKDRLVKASFDKALDGLKPSPPHQPKGFQQYPAFNIPVVRLPKEMRCEQMPVGGEFTYDPTESYGRCTLVGADVWSKETVRLVQKRELESLRGQFPAEAQKRLKWTVIKPSLKSDDLGARGFVAWRIDPAPAKRKGKR